MNFWLFLLLLSAPKKADAAQRLMHCVENRDKEAIEAALKSKPNDYDLLIRQGHTYQLCGDQSNAIQSFLLAAKVKHSSEVFYDIGLSFFLLHEYERAGKHFAHAAKLDDKNHKA